jgi:hypothetical protein
VSTAHNVSLETMDIDADALACTVEPEEKNTQSRYSTDPERIPLRQHTVTVDGIPAEGALETVPINRNLTSNILAPTTGS